MNLDALQRKLIAAARAHRPAETVPYAFEKRVMARLAGLAGEDSWQVWGRALWRAAGISLALALFVSAAAFLPFGQTRTASTSDEEFEAAVFVGADQLSDSW
jgi:hypothetical protein